MKRSANVLGDGEADEAANERAASRSRLGNMSTLSPAQQAQAALLSGLPLMSTQPEAMGHSSVATPHISHTLLREHIVRHAAQTTAASTPTPAAVAAVAAAAAPTATNTASAPLAYAPRPAAARATATATTSASLALYQPSTPVQSVSCHAGVPAPAPITPVVPSNLGPMQSTSPVATLPREPNTDPLQGAVQSYLNDRQNIFKVTIMSARVAQKSYGSEKRFFCPPPCVYFHGDAWTAHLRLLRVFIGVDDNGADFQPLALERDRLCAAKTLFISDSDGRRNISLKVKVFIDKGLDFGTFLSQPIKVISKPSKKKQSLKNVELCFSSGTEIALFNRLRSQTLHTKYLATSGVEMVPESLAWGAFAINAIERRETGGEFIQYGMKVKLRCALSGKETAPLIIRKVDKKSVLLDADDPVSQLHKVGLHLDGQAGMYMGIVSDTVTSIPAQAGETRNAEIVDETALWSIISTARIEYAFHIPTGLACAPVTPVPVVDAIKVRNRTLVEITGHNLSARLTVFFDDCRSVTMYRCAELILCHPPLYEELSGQRTCTAPHQARLSLVRNDGIVFPTTGTYVYDKDP